MKQRNHAFDLLCGICIVRMMMLHVMSFCQMQNQDWWMVVMHWTYFFMSFFFFKAGYFNKTLQGDTCTFLVKKTKQLIVPYVVWGVLGAVVYLSFAWLVLPSNNTMVKAVTPEHLWLTSSFFGNGPVWFLMSFFMAYVAMHFISKADEWAMRRNLSVRLSWVVLLFPFISYKLCEMGNPLWLNLNNVFWGIFLFLLGRLWHECLDQYERRPMMALSVAMIAVFVVLNIWDIGEYTMSGNLWTGYYPATLLKTLCALCGFSGFFLLLPTPRVPVLGYIGEHSMVFFVAHYPLLTFYQMLRSSFVRTLRGHWDDMIILTLLIFVFCFWIVPFVERVPWLSGRFKSAPKTDIQPSNTIQS